MWCRCSISGGEVFFQSDISRAARVCHLSNRSHFRAGKYIHCASPMPVDLQTPKGYFVSVATVLIFLHLCDRSRAFACSA